MNKQERKEFAAFLEENHELQEVGEFDEKIQWYREQFAIARSFDSGSLENERKIIKKLFLKLNLESNELQSEFFMGLFKTLFISRKEADRFFILLVLNESQFARKTILSSTELGIITYDWLFSIIQDEENFSISDENFNRETHEDEMSYELLSLRQKRLIADILPFFISLLQKNSAIMSHEEITRFVVFLILKRSSFDQNDIKTVVEKLEINDFHMQRIALSLFKTYEEISKYTDYDLLYGMTTETNEVDEFLEKKYPAYFIERERATRSFFIDTFQNSFLDVKIDWIKNTRVQMLDDDFEKFEHFLTYYQHLTAKEKIDFLVECLIKKNNMSGLTVITESLQIPQSLLLQEINAEDLIKTIKEKYLRGILLNNENLLSTYLIEDLISGHYHDEEGLSDNEIQQQLAEILPIGCGISELAELKKYLQINPHNGDRYDLRTFLCILSNFDYRTELLPMLKSQGQSAYQAFKSLSQLPGISEYQEQERSFLVGLFKKKRLGVNNIIVDLLQLTQPLKNHLKQLKEFLQYDIISYPLYIKYFRSNSTAKEKIISNFLEISDHVYTGSATEEEILSPEGTSALSYVFAPQMMISNNSYKRLYAKRTSETDNIVKNCGRMRRKIFTLNRTKAYLSEGVRVDFSLWNAAARGILQTHVEIDANSSYKQKYLPQESSDLHTLLSMKQNQVDITERCERTMSVLYRHHLSKTPGERLTDYFTSRPASLRQYQEFIEIRTRQGLIDDLIVAYERDYPNEYFSIQREAIHSFEKSYVSKLISLVKAIKKQERFGNISGENYTACLTLLRQHLGFSDLEEETVLKMSGAELSRIGQINFSVNKQDLTKEFILSKLTKDICSKMDAEIEKFTISQIETDSGQQKFEFLISKKREHCVIGLNMGVCTAYDDVLWNDPNISNVIIFDKKLKKALGGFCLQIVGDMLILPTINPSEILLDSADTDELLNKILIFAQLIQRQLGLSALGIAADKEILSNRKIIIEKILARDYATKTFSEPVPFSDRPSYSMKSYFLVP